MNKFVFSALAAPLISATGLASDTEWPELDRELAALSNAPLTQDSGGPYLGGWLIGVFDYNADAEIGGTGADKGDLTDVGFGIRSARLNVAGSVAENYGYKIGFDFFETNEMYSTSSTPPTPGTAGITDAYGTVAIQDVLNVKMGIFNGPCLRSARLDRNKTLFLDRSFLGYQQADRDVGLALDGDFDRVHWELAATNGFDGRTDGFGWAVGVDVDILGEMSDVEGAWGAQEGTNLNIGLYYSDDTSDYHAGDLLPDGSPATPGQSRDAATLSADATLVAGAFTVFAEVVDYDKGVGAMLPNGTVTDINNTPWSAGLAYLFGEVYEVAFRYDDLDVGQNGNPVLYDTKRYNFGINRYIAGHDVKWQLQFAFGDSKSSASSSAGKIGEHSIFSIGLALGF